MKHVYQPIQSLLKKSSSCFHHLIAVGALSLLPLFASAQAPLVANNPYTQDFNSLTNSVTATWQNNQTLPGWYVQQDAKTPALITPNNGSNINTELFSFGVGSSSDRSLGGISSVSAGKFVYVLRLVNNTGQQVTKLNVQFDLVQFYNNPGASERFGVSYKTTNIASTIANKELHTNTGWTIVNDKIKTPSKGRPGVRPATDSKSFSLDIENLNLADGEEILIRFEDAMNTKNKGLNAIGIDNISVTANPGVPASKIYHFVGSGNGNTSNDDLTILTNWKTNKNGSGTSPDNFTDNFQLFLIDVAKDNNGNGQPETQAPILRDGQNWEVKGQGSKVILGDKDNSSVPFELTIEPTAKFAATIDLHSNSIFNIDNSNFNKDLPHFTPIDIDLVEANSTVNYRGNASVQQYLSEADYYNLSVSGSAIKNLSGYTAATAKLELNNTNKLYLNDFDLLVGDGTNTSGTISGFGPTGYVVTNGLGSLQSVVPSNNSEVFFPVGRTSYNPARLKQNTGSETDIFSVRVQSGLFDLYNADNTGVEPAVVDGVSRTWVIDEAIPGGSDANLSLLFSNNNTGNDWAPSFDPGKAVLAQYVSSWSAPTVGKASPSIQNMLEVSQNNISSFRLFGVLNYDHQGLVPLPVEFLSFNATRVNSQVELKWSTASEKENEYFTIEQSGDGYTFSEVAKVKGAGNSNRKLDYSFVHKNAPARLNYYRLKQTDFDGTTSYSKIVAVDGKQGATALSVYPNPGAGRFTLAGVNELLNATVVDATGRTVKTLTSLDTDYSFDLSDQKAGIYFLRLTTGNEVKTLRLIKK